MHENGKLLANTTFQLLRQDSQPSFSVDSSSIITTVDRRFFFFLFFFIPREMRGIAASTKASTCLNGEQKEWGQMLARRKTRRRWREGVGGLAAN